MLSWICVYGLRVSLAVPHLWCSGFQIARTAPTPAGWSVFGSSPNAISKAIDSYVVSIQVKRTFGMPFGMPETSTRDVALVGGGHSFHAKNSLFPKAQAPNFENIFPFLTNMNVS
jgi:hypothetical protein